MKAPCPAAAAYEILGLLCNAICLYSVCLLLLQVPTQMIKFVRCPGQVLLVRALRACCVPEAHFTASQLRWFAESPCQVCRKLLWPCYSLTRCIGMSPFAENSLFNAASCEELPTCSMCMTPVCLALRRQANFGHPELLHQHLLGLSKLSECLFPLNHRQFLFSDRPVLLAVPAGSSNTTAAVNGVMPLSSMASWQVAAPPCHHH